MSLLIADYKVANGTFNCLVMRYSGPQGRIYFDDFMLCVARLKTMLGELATLSSKRVYVLSIILRPHVALLFPHHVNTQSRVCVSFKLYKFILK